MVVRKTLQVWGWKSSQLPIWWMGWSNWGADVSCVEETECPPVTTKWQVTMNWIKMNLKTIKYLLYFTYFLTLWPLPPHWPQRQRPNLLSLPSWPVLQRDTYLLGGIWWFAILFLLATSLGLACRSWLCPYWQCFSRPLYRLVLLSPLLSRWFLPTKSIQQIKWRRQRLSWSRTGTIVIK